MGHVSQLWEAVWRRPRPKPCPAGRLLPSIFRLDPLNTTHVALVSQLGRSLRLAVAVQDTLKGGAKKPELAKCPGRGCARTRVSAGLSGEPGREGCG